MNNVIISNAFTNQKCPVGSAAMLAGTGFCEIIAVDGLMRTVSFAKGIPLSNEELVKDLPAGVLPEEVMFGEELEYAEKTVHVSELQPLNPHTDHLIDRQRLAGVRSIAS